VGLSGATITLSGYEPYSATANATGYFTINNVFVNHTYQYLVQSQGYADTSGEVVVGSTNLDMGTVVSNQVAYPPTNVVATEAANHTNVVLNWVAPGSTTGEGFETGNFSAYPWVLGGNANWTVVNTAPHSGTYCAQSGDITHSQASSLSVVRNVAAAGEISFWYKVSSEGGWDYLHFYIDGEHLGSWCGEVDWTQVFYPVTTGEHTFAWEYTKDGSVDMGADCGWIDDISFPVHTRDNGACFSTAGSAEASSARSTVFGKATNDPERIVATRFGACLLPIRAMKLPGRCSLPIPSLRLHIPIIPGWLCLPGCTSMP
jgi:hypothetical protein